MGERIPTDRMIALRERAAQWFADRYYRHAQRGLAQGMDAYRSAVAPYHRWLGHYFTFGWCDAESNDG